MSKKFFGIISLILTAVMLFASCQVFVMEETTAEGADPGSESTTVKEEKTTEEETTDAAGGNLAEESTTDVFEATPTDAPASESESVSEEASSETTVAPVGTVIGYTLKGNTISEKDGITYIDGILIANKTYSLPADYNPGDLLEECKIAFNEMKSVAAGEGLEIWNASGFRSYELQDSLYTRYSNRDGKEAADRYSARPGHSEHQSGLAIDLNDITNAFKDTAEGKWIAENCHKYGFILRYPEGKEAQTGYMYEPWHIRYVGIDTATKIYESGLCLEEYFGITSSYASAESVSEAETVVLG